MSTLSVFNGGRWPSSGHSLSARRRARHKQETRQHNPFYFLDLKCTHTCNIRYSGKKEENLKTKKELVLPIENQTRAE